MFQLALINDIARVSPPHFALAPHKAIKIVLNTKYANKVLQDVGLCVAVFDLLDCEEGKTIGGDGALFYKVTFRLVIFRPFLGEVFVGKIVSSDPSGIRVSVGFFQDIHVPPHLLPYPSAFDHKEGCFFWLWEPANDDVAADPLLSDADQRMYMDRDELIRVAVESDEFHEPEPGPITPQSAAFGSMMSTGTNLGLNGAIARPVADEKRESAYRITCSCASQGLGVVAWWGSAQAEGEEADEEMQAE
ncbi:hypothetical protein IE81DRAFT_337682 [Ceraceosorus guamensis]|uniref:DNA-directed RNA polymerase III subunit RPC8 n=1 Tax=Ceraceosorus guamensis TaxID=1522189 RepID=A0A316VZQ1_9BASI|nr:hypothetical protein IE81DRAFT_337682 [Ceraceosorus guamensis]PWN41761.1 hypothetical protein IE81DRAFT_337682 [Ceraceosorus guamensis]